MKSLIISPQAGFANRLRAIASAKIIADLCGRELFHYWVEDEVKSGLAHVNEVKSITPSYIFDLEIPTWNGGSPNVCFSEWTPGDYWFEQQSTAYTKLKPNRIVKFTSIDEILNCQEETILIETGHELRHHTIDLEYDRLMSIVYAMNFRLNDRWKSIYEQIPKFDSGFSIRRCDHLSFVPEAYISESQAIEKIQSIKGTKFITSDDKEFADLIRKSTKNYFTPITDLSSIDEAIYTFLCLSKCERLFGTFASSFAKQAAYFGNKQFELI